MKIQVKRIAGFIDVGRDTKGWLLTLPDKTSKHAVPKSEQRAEVFVEVFVIWTMMYPVIGGSYENPFNQAGQLFDIFRMLPELKQYHYLVHHKKHDGMKSE